MLRSNAPSSDSFYVDTPRGLFTASGTWFRTTEPLLHEYAGPVVERVGLGRLLRDTEAWIGSPRTVALWWLPLALWFLPPIPALFSMLVVYFGWGLVSPGFVTRAGQRVMRALDLVLLQLFFYVFVLSALAAQEAFYSVWAGLLGFILLRWGLIELLFRAPLRALHARMYRLPVPDQVLRATIVRAALKQRVQLPEIEAMERRLLDHLR